MPSTSSSPRRGRIASAVVLAVVTTAVAAYGVARHLVPASYPKYFTERLDAPRADRIDVADPGTALTFARVDRGGAPRLLLVRTYENGQVGGVEVPGADDPVSAFAAHGYDRLRALAEDPARPVVQVPAAELLMSFTGRPDNIAMGTNYPEHGAETTVDSAFLFPKLTGPTGPHTRLPAGDGLLDYEVELGLVALDDIPQGETDPRHMGLVLTNDWTDREVLLDRADLADITGGRGFTDAKSRPGYLTTGDLFVVPADWQSYYRGLRIELYVDDELRQRGTPADQLWDASTMLAQVWAAGDRTWDHDGVARTVTDVVGTIPARTILQSGTPEGVVFRPPDTRQIVLGSVEHVATLGQNAASFQDSASRLYVAEAKEDRAYLQPGNRVVSRADGLGRIVTDIVDGPAPA